ncbi:MAG: phage holin family protein [Anaerolineae bacterium]
MGVIFSLIIGFLVAALVIYIVGRMNMGLTVASYGAAFIAAIVIAVVASVVYWFLSLFSVSLGTGLLGAIIYIIIAAVVLMISDRFVPGMQVAGFAGAIAAAIAIGIVYWIVLWFLSLFGMTVIKPF